MRILIVAATKPEVVPVLSRMYSTPTGEGGVDSYTHGAHDVDVVITGVGMVATAVWCSHALARREYDLALNLVNGSVGTLAPNTICNTPLRNSSPLFIEFSLRSRSSMACSIIGQWDL